MIKIEKRFALVLILILLVLGLASIANAEKKKDVELNIGESVVVWDRNITLVGSNKDSFLLCMNGQNVVVMGDKMEGRESERPYFVNQCMLSFPAPPWV